MRISPDTYSEALTILIGQLNGINAVKSAVLFGSLAKGDIVPGWSDIDVLVFVSNGLHDSSLYDRLHDCVNDARNKFALDLSFDIVLLDQFKETGSIPGRPWYFSFEVARYGKVITGKQLLRPAEPAASDYVRFADERQQLVASEMHRWRRFFASDSQMRMPSHSSLSRLMKTCLRLLQCETGPLLEPPFTNAAALLAFKSSHPCNPAIQAFSLALQLRSNWAHVMHDIKMTSDCHALLADHLMGYNTQI